VLVTHVTAGDATVQATLQGVADRLLAAGSTAADAAFRAPAVLAALLHQQASLLGSLDCFWVLGALAMVGPLLTLGIRSFGQKVSGVGAH
jgi:hypothetical protein